jgi:protein gp37
MAETRIEWTDATWNPTTGCNKISAGCKNCYAKRDWARLSKNPATVYFGREFEDVRMHPERLETPLRWTKPRRIFVNSMSDLFHEAVPFTFIDKVFAVMALTPRHTYQVLTKRADRMRQYFERDDLGVTLRNLHASTPGWARNGANSNRVTLPLRNVWLGVSVENQDQADKRIPELFKIPARIRFLSCEPLLGPVDIPRAAMWHFEDCACLDCFDRRMRKEEQPGIDWVIVGGESGPKARPMHPEWARSLRDQCQEMGAAYFFKQWGHWQPFCTQAGYRAGSVWPGNDEFVGGDCGGPSTLSHFGNGVCLAKWPDGTTKRVQYLNRADHHWGKENLLAMTYVAAGKQRSGRILDGREWNEFPKLAAEREAA